MLLHSTKIFCRFLFLQITIQDILFKKLMPTLLEVCGGLVPIVAQSHTGLHERPIQNSTHELAKLSSLFSAFRKMFKVTKSVPKCFIMSVEHY